jgi:O-acetyl-ADP-ribose deacetylase (regulator of RNase III)
MMCNGVEVVVGDLFESSAQTLVNTVNCVGVMGKGVALEFRKRFPDMYKDYLGKCERGEVRLGRPYLYRSLLPPHVLNFPTKGDWRAAARLDDIIGGLEYLKDHYEEWGIESLAVPPLGCGYGGLDWSIVGPTLYQHLSELGIPIQLFAPYGTPHEELQPRYLQRSLASVGASNDPEVAPAPRVEPAWVALAGTLARIHEDPHHWPIGKTSFQKLAYFATVAGLPTGLAFTKGRHGPYAAGLTSIVTRLANNGLIQERRLGRMTALSPGRTYEAAERANAADLSEWSRVVDRVADLFTRFPRTRDAELAASVHFSAESLQRALGYFPTEEAVVEDVLTWKHDKDPPLDEEEVRSAIRTLAMLGWIKLQGGDEAALNEFALAGLNPRG